MICPTCNNVMIVVEHKKIEFDHCPNCRGVWFDSGELELLLESLKLESRNQFLGNVLKAEEADIPEHKRRCPICRTVMKKTNISEQPGLHIDVCKKGDGLWFDGGEVNQLIKQLANKPSTGADAQQYINAFLKEVFQALD